MNWEQLYASSTPEERLEAVILMLQAFDARHNKLILAKGRLINERRGGFRGAHFINDSRSRSSRSPRPIFLIAFAFILLTVSTATWLFITHSSAQLAAVYWVIVLGSFFSFIVIYRSIVLLFLPRRYLQND